MTDLSSCTYCHARCLVAGPMYLEARHMSPVPRQKERYVVVTRWQCSAVQSHSGEEIGVADVKP